MKISLISDSHFGHKTDSLLFHNTFVKFYDDIFFPELQRRGIKTIIHLGDLFDRRKYINFHILHRTRIDFFQKLVDGAYDTHIILGNHDVTFRDTNEVNSVRELCSHYPNFHIYEQPQEVTFDKLRVLIVPWLNPTDMVPGLKMISKSKCPVIFGHLEISGFNMSVTQICERGMDRSIFKKFKKVYSGHFHHPNTDGKIQYLGSPYEMTFADLDDPRGFYIFDTDTLELEFIKNPNKMFYRLIYDDREPQPKIDLTQFENKFLKVVVTHKTDPNAYEKWVDALFRMNPAELHINDQSSLEVVEDAEDQFLEFDESNKTVVMSDTLTIINKYIDAIGVDVDKHKLKTIFHELYVEANG
jgi:DNA repair exonuclease SbcCD nuclease subunit